MDTALPQKFPFILDRNLAKANCTENRVCTSCDTVVLAINIFLLKTSALGRTSPRWPEQPTKRWPAFLPVCRIPQPGPWEFFLGTVHPQIAYFGPILIPPPPTLNTSLGNPTPLPPPHPFPSSTYPPLILPLRAPSFLQQQ